MHWLPGQRHRPPDKPKFDLSSRGHTCSGPSQAQFWECQGGAQVLDTGAIAVAGPGVAESRRGPPLPEVGAGGR